MLMSGNVVPKRMIGFDFLKYISSFMVICIHMPYFGKEYLEPLTRFAVPFFFMVTGYFYSSVCGKGRAIQQLHKIFRLFLGVNLLFLCWGILLNVVNGQSVGLYLKSLFDMTLLVRFVFLNGSPIAVHLWYVGALLYVLILIFVFERFCSREKLYMLIPVLILLNVILGNYSSVLLGVRSPLALTRNFLFVGLPFFLLGDYIRRAKASPGNRNLVILAVCAAILTVAESMFLRNSGREFNQECFFATPFLSYALFRLALQNGERLGSHPWIRALAQLGKDTSTTIYVIHPIVIFVAEKIAKFLGTYVPVLDTLYFYVAPIVVLAESTAAGLLYNAVMNRIKSRFHK